MSKRINASTLKADVLAKLSSYNQATLVLRNLAEAFKADNEALFNKKAEILEARQTALDEGKSVDEVTAEFSIIEVDKEINARAEKYKSDCEPWRTAQRNARNLIPKDIYKSYVEAFTKGNINNYMSDVKTFLLNLGIQVPTVAQLNKVSRQFVIRTSGARRASSKKAAEGNYISEKSKVQYADLFMLAVLQWLVADKKVLKVLSDNTLVRVEY